MVRGWCRTEGRVRRAGLVFDLTCHLTAYVSSGEDIDVSVGDEEEDDGDELVFDDFCLRDNDLGSEADPDEDRTVPDHRVPSGREICGPYLVTGTGLKGPAFRYTPQGTLEQFTGEQQADPTNLMRYGTVVHACSDPVAPSGNAVALLPSGPPAEKAVNKVVAPLTGQPCSTFQFSNDELVDLIQLVHGQKHGMPYIIEELRKVYPHVPKRQIKLKVGAMAMKGRSDTGHGSHRWQVTDRELLQRLDLEVRD